MISGTAGPPPNLQIESKSTTSVKLSWDKPIIYGGGDITEYHVRTKGMDSPGEKTSTTNSIEITDLTHATRYSFKVAAENKAGIGSYSIEKETITISEYQ